MRAFLWVLGICAVLFLTLLFFRDNLRRLIFSNDTLVQTKGSISPKHLRIDWTAEGLRDTITIYNNGYETGVVYEAAGFNIFLLYHRNQYLGQFDHFKGNAAAAHTYVFQLQEQQDSVYLDLKIFGPDANQ